MTLKTLRITLSGRVQGVGFRPFVYRLAGALGVRGWVRNETGRVEILAQADDTTLTRFLADLVDAAPPLARPRLEASRPTTSEPLAAFHIATSTQARDADIHLPPDYFACNDCLAEMGTPGERRHRYPFTNCTQCGPRYTLITALPYDRPNTTLADFPLCPDCAREYGDPMDRRFHAQPLACPVCGPHLTYRGEGVTHEREAALEATLEALRAGRIVAVKGVGGYHLMCDARNDLSVAMLRARKPRPHKPLAVMLPLRGDDGLAAVHELVLPNEEETALLRSPLRPIVLVARRGDARLSGGIAPGLGEVGLMLPYSPLHHLLLDAFDGPLVATSGNLSGEPVLTDNGEAETRLAHVADAFLHHNRPIARPADDSVYRRIGGRCRPLRLGRGVAPLELELPFELPLPTLALGAQMKNCVALGWGRRVVISPHIGELESPRGLAVFEQVCTDLQRLYRVRAERIVRDAHPGFRSRRWSDATGLPCFDIYHHHAHAAALAGEHPDVDQWLTLTWDGVGYGPDGTLWGGEALLGRPGAWRRFAALRPFRLPGGDRVSREPWRSAAALCWELGIEWDRLPEGGTLLRQAWERGLNCPPTSAMGRLFDAAAALLGIANTASFEGQGPMQLEALSGEATGGVALPLEADAEGVLRCDWAPLVPTLIDRRTTPDAGGALLHDTLALTALEIARRARDDHGAHHVGLAGGVFQNRRLTQRLFSLLEQEGFNVHLGKALPVNDAGIAFGQLVESAALRPTTSAI